MRSYFFGFGGMQWTPTCVGVTVVLYFCRACAGMTALGGKFASMEGWPQAGVVLFFYSLHTPLLPSYRRRPVSIAFVFLWLWWNTVDPDLRRGDGGFVFLSRLSQACFVIPAQAGMTKNNKHAPVWGGNTETSVKKCPKRGILCVIWNLFLPKCKTTT